MAASAQSSFAFVRNQVVVSARLQGRGPYDCLVDTGADPSVVDSALATELGLPLGSGSGLAEGIGSERVDLRPTRMVAAVEGTKESLLDAVSIDLSPLSRAYARPVRCILGQNWLSTRVVQIDYPRRLLRFAPAPGDAPAPAQACEQFPMRFWKADDLMPLVVVQVNGKDIPVSLDTGSSATLRLFPDGALKAGIAAAVSDSPPAAVTGIRGKSPVRRAVADTLRFGPLSLAAAQISIGERNEGEGEGRSGNLGNVLFGQAVLTLDYPARRIVVCSPTP